MVHIFVALSDNSGWCDYGARLRPTAKVSQAQVAERYQVATAELLLKRRRIWSDNKRFLSNHKFPFFCLCLCGKAAKRASRLRCAITCSC